MLRRFTASFRRQDWTAVAVELVVVVAGVFIGVQASNWNEQRQANQKADIFTQRLKADLRTEAWNYEAGISYSEQVLADAQRAVDALTGGKPLSDEALLIAAYRATQYIGAQHRRATYDELTATGEIGLIRDAALRTLAMDVYTQPEIDEVRRHGLESEYRRAFRMAIPYPVQQALADRCGDRVSAIGDFASLPTMLDHPCTTGLAAETIAASVALLKRDPRFVALLRLRIADIRSDVGNLKVYLAPQIRMKLRQLVEDKP